MARKVINARWFSDPGHAWLRVSAFAVEKSGAKVSHYSYRRGQYAYLEEDCDAPRFLEVAKLQGLEVRICGTTNCRSGYSQIRRYEQW